MLQVPRIAGPIVDIVGTGGDGQASNRQHVQLQRRFYWCKFKCWVVAILLKSCQLKPVHQMLCGFWHCRSSGFLTTRVLHPHQDTFNISTAAGLVAAGAGAGCSVSRSPEALPHSGDLQARIVKHGNRAASSKSGAADILEAWQPQRSRASYKPGGKGGRWRCAGRQF